LEPHKASDENAMTTPALTAAQKRALMWLPADGGWTTEKAPDRSTVQGLQMLTFKWLGLAEYEFGDFGARGGRCIRRRLTPDGIAARKEIG
jgi:hypothetical protein